VPSEVTVAVISAELLFTPDCPHAERAEALLHRILAQEGVAVRVERVPVVGLGQAAALGFAGSPTIRVDGVDVEGEAEGVGLACRLYRRADGGIDTVPSEAAVRAAVRTAAGALREGLR
jgi:hypothetical protein